MSLTYRLPLLLFILLFFSVSIVNAQYVNKLKYPVQNKLNNIGLNEYGRNIEFDNTKKVIHNARGVNAIFAEDFDGIPGPTAGGPGTYVFPSGWVLANVDGLTPAAAVAYVNDAWERREDFKFNVGDSAVFSTSWYAPGGQADDWMITPAINIGSASILKWNAVSYDPLYPDGYEVRISTTTQDVAGCLANPVLYSITSENSSWTERTIDLAAAGYANQTVYIAFRNHSFDMFLLLIDDVVVEAQTNFDAELISLQQPSEYTRIPEWQNYPMILGGTVRNNGSTSITNVVLTAKVYQDNTLIHTELSSPVASIAPGSTSAISMNSFVPTDTGHIEIKYVVSINEVDPDPSNDSASVAGPYYTVSEFARDNNINNGSLGIGAGNGGELGSSFVNKTAGYLRGVKAYFTKCYTNQPVFAFIRGFDNGKPSDVLAVTDTFYAPDNSARWVNLNISNEELSLPADTFVVTINEVDSTLALGLATDIFTPKTCWVNWPTNPFGGWANNEDFGSGFAKPYMLRPLIYELSIPVELVSFNASLNNSKVILNWNTATEINNSGFSIQRKTDNHWNDIGFVAGNGTTTEKNSYSFVDDISMLENNAKIYYRLKQIDYNGTFSYSDEVNIESGAPRKYSLEQNYPNPFNPATTIKYSIAKDGFVKVEVFNLIGEKVAVLVNTNQKAGSYEIKFDAAAFSSGLYFYSIQSEDYNAVRKMVLMK